MDVDEACKRWDGPVDVVLQASSQSITHRICLYLNSGVSIVPERYRSIQATETGPRSDHQGPCIALLTGVSATPAEWLRWFQSADWLRRNTVRVYFLPAAAAPAGANAAEAPQNPAAAATHGSVDELVQFLIDQGAPECALRLQCSPRTAEREIAERLDAAGFRMDPREGVFGGLLNVVCLDGRWRCGYAPAGLHFRLSDTAQRTFPHLSSSAVNKLDEALRICGFDAAPLRGCVDLGAAPGAWTELLAARASRVVAVDPAALSERCAALPNVAHVRKTSGRAGGDIAAALAGDPLDALVCDMNAPPYAAAAAVAPLLPLLQPGGWLVMTCKLGGVGRDRAAVEAKVTSMPEFAGLVNKQFYWLIANTVNERTFIAQQPASPA